MCHSQCQASQCDPGTQRGLTDLPPADLSPSGQRPAGPIDSPDEEVFSSSACSPLFDPHAPGLTLQPPERHLNCVLHADRSSWCLRGPFFEITDNYKGLLLTGPCQYKFPLLISNQRKAEHKGVCFTKHLLSRRH